MQGYNKELQEYNNDLKKLIFWTIGTIIITISIIIMILSGNNKTSDTTRYQAYSYSQTLVKEKLKSPKSADFPWYSDSFIKEKGDTIIVSAYVDAQNSFGATIRTNYIATIKIKNGEPISGSVVLVE